MRYHLIIRADMSKKAYIIINIATGLVKAGALFSIIFWLLPLWGINIPVWVLVLTTIAFFAYEIVTFRLGRKALERKPVIWHEALIGRCGKATTDLNPDGYVKVDGELWHAHSDDASIKKGDSIIVLGLDRITLRVTLSCPQYRYYNLNHSRS